MREFWLFLRENGIDAVLDLAGADRRTDWARWTSEQVRDAGYVLVIASPEYRRRTEGDVEPDEGRGIQSEGWLIRDRVYADQDSGMRVVLPVVLPGCSPADIPEWLAPAAATYFTVQEFTVAGAEPLLRVLTGQSQEVEPPLGLRPDLPPRSAVPAPEPEPDNVLPFPDSFGRARRQAAYRLSASARSAVALAGAMAGPRPVDASVVLLAVLRYVRDQDHGGIPGDLYQALVARAVGIRGTEFLDRLARALGADPLGQVALDEAAVTAVMQAPPLSYLLAHAAYAAERTSGEREVHLRHLVLATVLASNPPLRTALLAAMAVSPAELRAVVRRAARTDSSQSGDSGAAWNELLSAAPPASGLAGGMDADLVDPTRDIPLDKDDLGVGVWASMLAAVVVDGRTPTPLSVGIFGEWGSGKSYFMGLLRSEIKRLSGSGREPYLRDVVQIGFNAWHYADANLWASLGDEIFRQLAGPGETADARRRKLREDLAKGTAERQALEARTAQARAETVRLQAELETATAERNSGAVGLLAAAESAGFGKRLNKVWQRIGIHDQARQARLLADEVRGAAAAPSPLRSLLARPRTWIFAGIGLVALVAIIAAAWLPASWTNWLAGAGAAALVAAVTNVVALLTQAGQGLSQLKAIATELSNDLASPDEQAPAGVRDAVGRLREAEAAEKVAQAQLDEVVTQVGQLARQLSDLMPGQRLYAFLAERAASGPYAGQLGLISTIRKDFEHLVELLQAWRREGGTEEAPRPIDRIVLYIDDLDRCRPRQVVEVLQAVHLLLALDLFVVVVGVDPRWLVRSLQHQFHDTIDAESGPADAAGEPWNVTPHNYLEKIFNIPFALPGIPVGGLGRVLRGMSGADGIGNQAGAAPMTAEPGPADAGEARDAVPAPEPAAAVPIEERSELAEGRDGGTDDPPQPLAEQELELLGALESFIGTPREAKRLFNLYRMLRSTRDLSYASSFLGDQYTPGEYQAVATLLGMLTANAQLLEKVIDTPPQADPETAGGLAWRHTNDHWQGFACDLEPVRQADGTWFNPIIGKIPTGEVPEWRQFATAAAGLDALITLPDLSVFQRWAPRIRQFSFTLAKPNTQPPSYAELEAPR